MASDAHLACTAKLRAEARERAGQASYPAFGVEAQLEAGALEALGEVHLRRLDSPALLHRRAVTVISIEATPQEARRAAGATWLMRRADALLPKPSWRQGHAVAFPMPVFIALCATSGLAC